MSHFGLERKILGIKIFFGQLTFLLDILLEDFLELFPILLDLLEIDSFLKYYKVLIIKINKPIIKIKYAR